MKTLLLLSFLTILSCSKQTSDISYKYSLPEGLQDCKIYVMQTDGLGSNLVVVRCPNSQTSTTYKSGKTTKSTTVVDG